MKEHFLEWNESSFEHTAWLDKILTLLLDFSQVLVKM